MIKILKKGASIEKLAHKLATMKSSTIKYKEGLPEEKVWINFQSSKKQKRSFAEWCDKNQINASAFLRNCVDIFISTQGDVNKTITKLKNENVVS